MCHFEGACDWEIYLQLVDFSTSCRNDIEYIILKSRG